MVQELKELRSDENDPLFDKTNMLKKERLMTLYRLQTWAMNMFLMMPKK